MRDQPWLRLATRAALTSHSYCQTAPQCSFTEPAIRRAREIDAQLLAQLRERSLRSLYCSSDGVRRRGAAVTNLSHSTSFHS